MAIRLIATDIDGTLIYGCREEPTERVKAALRAAQEKGVKVALATGRMPVASRFYTRWMSEDAMAIFANGALLAKPGGEVEQEVGMDPDGAREVWDRGIALGLGVVAWTKSGLYLNREDGPMKVYRGVAICAPVWTAKVIEDVEEVIPEGIVKMLWVAEEAVIDEVLKDLDAEGIPGVDHMRSEKEYIEMVRPGVSKGTGLALLAERMGLRRDEIMAIGDEMNDLAMIEYAGYGIAMGSAPEKVRQAAVYTTGTAEEDGLALAIERFVLGEKA